MFKYIVKKILMMIPMLLLISFIVYFGLQLTGIDPINFMVSPEMLSSNKENVANWSNIKSESSLPSIH